MGGGGGVSSTSNPTHSIRSDYEFYQMGMIHLLKTFIDIDQFKIRMYVQYMCDIWGFYIWIWRSLIPVQG